MKDRISLVATFIGAIILCVVIVINRDPNYDSRTFGRDNFYTPGDVQRQADSAAELYQSMTGQRSITCPISELKRTNNTTINVTSLFGSNLRNAYGANNLMFTTLGIGLSDSDANLKKNSDGSIQQFSGFSNSMITSKDAVNIYSMFGIASDVQAIEIVAPFTFWFNNVNTTDGTNIIISNTANTCKITFAGVANWFCAGEVGNGQTLRNGTSNNVVPWEEHTSNHHTIIGDTSNADVKGGSARDLIGYAGPTTTMQIEVLSGDGWTPISLYDFVTTTSSY